MLEDIVLKEFKTAMTARPNCTAYLVWYYLKNKNYSLALSEFRRDMDKIPSFCFVRGKREIMASLEALADTSLAGVHGDSRG